MPRSYPPELRRQVVELARAGTRVAVLADTFGVSEVTVYNWLKQDRRSWWGARANHRSTAGAGRREAADRAFRDRAGGLQEDQRGLPEGGRQPKRLFPGIASLTGQRSNVQQACWMLGVSQSGYDAWKDRPDPPRTLRRIRLAGEIADVHRASGGTYGANRVTAELKYGRSISVGHHAVEQIMRELGIRGTPTRRLPRGARVANVTSLDLVRRVFARDRPNALWVTDITEHPTNEGKVYSCVVLDTFSRAVAGWAIDSTQTTALVLNALGMATGRREHGDGLIVHSDRGTQFTSWTFTNRLSESGIAPSMGAVGAARDNAMMESFWARPQVEVRGRRRWKTRSDLATAIHDYIQFPTPPLIARDAHAVRDRSCLDNGQHHCGRRSRSC